MSPAESAARAAPNYLWLLGVAALIILVLAAQAALGYGREARRARHVERNPRRFHLALAAAAAALGSGVWAATVLAVAGEPVGFTLGYRPLELLLAWIGAIALGWVFVAPAARNPSRLAVVGGGVLFGIGVALLQMAAVAAVDAEPGIEWELAGIVLAALVATIGAAGALRLVFRGAGRHGRHRHLLRWVASGFVAITVTLAQSLVLAGAGLPGQTGSLASEDLPPIVAVAIAGVVVPMGLIAALLQLWLLRETRRRVPADSTGSAAASGPATLPRR